MNFKSILKKDFRNYQFHKHFGSTTDFASLSESHFSDNVPLLIEPAGSVQCTIYSAVKMAFSQTGNSYDIDSAWANTPHTDQGTTPQNSLKSAVVNGLRNIATGQWDKIWNGYYQCDKSPNLDKFDAVRSAMFTCKSGATVATNFYANWLNLLIKAIVPDGVNIISEHDWYVADWIDSDTFLVDFHLGQLEEMTRDEFNYQVSKLGCGAYIAYGVASQKAVEISFAQMLITLLSPAGNYFADLILGLKRFIVQLSS